MHPTHYLSVPRLAVHTVFRAQAVAVPPRFCDDRVKVLQGDAREISPLVLQEYAPQGFDTVLSDMVRRLGTLVPFV